MEENKGKFPLKKNAPEPATKNPTKEEEGEVGKEKFFCPKENKGKPPSKKNIQVPTVEKFPIEKAMENSL